MGMPLDSIISRVGWVRASTFFKYYMKPTHQQEAPQPKIAKNSKTTSQKPTCTQSSLMQDPHKFTGFISHNTPHTGSVQLLQSAEVQAFKDDYAPKSMSTVYGPMPFIPCHQPVPLAMNRRQEMSFPEH